MENQFLALAILPSYIFNDVQGNSNSFLIKFSADRKVWKRKVGTIVTAERCVYPCKAGAIQDEGIKAISRICGQVMSLGKQLG